MVKHMKKRFVARKNKYNILLKIIVCILVVYIAFFLTIKILFKIKVNVSDEKRVNEYLAIASNNIIGEISVLDLVNMNLASPDTFLKLSFSNFKKLEFAYNKDVKDIKKVNHEVRDPIIYIYNTHQTEDYNPGSLREYNITPTVYMASVMLQKALEKKGIYSIVEETNIKEILNANGLTYGDSYFVTKGLLETTKKSYPSIKYYLDIHRDSVSGSVNIDDQSYAKLMFVVGMNHDNFKENDSLMTRLYNYIDENYYQVIKSNYYGQNSRYNQDFNTNTMLIEVGGPKNTIDEVHNSIMVLADALEKIIGEDSGE